jgi:hypothetical protein
MDPTRIRDLMKRLLDSTRAGKLCWEETADENTFRLILDVGILHVEGVRQPTSLGSSAQSNYRLSLLNENNVLVGVFEGGQSEDQRLLRELYEAARHSALRPNDFLRQVEQEVIRRSG